MAGATYVWVTNGSGTWSDPNNWEEIDPIPAFPAGPPTTGDAAAVAISGKSITLTGPGTAGTITLGTVDLSGDFSADNFTVADVTLTAGSISAAKQLAVGFGGTLSVQSGVVNGPAAPPDPTTEQFDNFGLVDLAFGTTLKSYEFLDDGTLQAGGRVTVNIMAVGSFFDLASSTSEAGSLDITGSGTVADTLGIIGSGDDASGASVAGGEWDNQQFIIASTVAAEATISGDGTVTATGGFNIAPEATEALAIGSAIDAGSGAVSATGTLTVTGVGSRVAVTGDVSVGHGGIGALTLEAGGVLDASGSLITSADVGSGADKATILVDTGGSLLQIASDATLGADGSAAVTINAGGSFTVGGALDVGLNAGGVGNLDIPGGLVTVVGDARIGDGGAGGLTLSAGGTFDVAGTLDEGVKTGGSGSSLFNDPADTLALGSDWIIGDAGAHSDSIDADMRITVPGALTLGAQTGGAGTLDVSALSASVTIDKDVTIGGGGSGTLDLASGATLEAFSGSLNLATGASTTGAVSLSDTGTRLSIGKDLVIGGAGAGTVTVGQGTTLDASGGALSLGQSPGGSGTLSLGTGVTVSPAADVTVGGAGSGSLDLAGDAVLKATSGTLTVGALDGAKGTITLSGANAAIDTDALVIGGAGTGSLTLSAQTTTSTTGDVTIGASQGGSGVLAIPDSAELSDGGNLIVGGAGQGSLDVNGGALNLFGSSFIVGSLASGNGDVSIRNTSIVVIGTVTIGSSGTATVSVNTQGVLEATSIAIGSGTDSTGTFVLDGKASSTQTGDMTVGASGVAAAQVTDGAALMTTGNATLASVAGPVQQSVTLDTAGSWNVGGQLDVGSAGSAALLVQDAAQLMGAQIIIADQKGADGTIAVSGTAGVIASALSFGKSLVIGGSGNGTLQVSGAAEVGPAVANTGTIDIGAQQDGIGVVTVTGTGSALSSGQIDIGGSGTTAGGAGTLEIGQGATVDADLLTLFPTGTIALAGGSLLTDPITVAGHVSGFGTIGGAVTNSGAIIAQGGSLTLTGAVDGSGTLGVATGATLELLSGSAAGQTIEFAGGTVQLDDAVATAGTFADFAAGDTIVLQGVTADGGNFAGGSLTLTEGTAAVGSLAFSGTFDSGDFSIGTVGTTTVITRASVACFAAGTHIATEHGEVAVEYLRAGDCVRARFGGLVPVVWIGHRQVDFRRHPEPASVWPVLISAGAFGAGLPRRDLRLSPDHSVYIDGVLVPIRCLINGRTIVQRRCQTVSYWHLELPAHDVVLAEGLPSESFLDTGNRSAFSNGGAAVMLHPMFASLTWEARGCAELVVHGPRLAAIRQRLAVHHQTKSPARRHL